MYLASRWLFRNLSRLELVAAWIVILVLIGAFARYMFVVFARAEQTMVERTVMNINTTLKYQVGMARMRGDYEHIGRIVLGNPVEHVRSFNPSYPLEGNGMEIELSLASLPALSAPSNYAGEIDDMNLESARKGNWYYNKNDGTLVYIVRNNEYFVTDLEGPERLRYRLDVDFEDTNNNGKFDPGVDALHGIGLNSMDEYKWVN
ncbi:MAG: hypothetical protein WD750_08035 [Gammaproteobacteria bacterium]